MEVRAAFTNTVPVDAYRGAGRPEATYLLERTIDVAARVTGTNLDRIPRVSFDLASGKVNQMAPQQAT